MIDAKNYLIEKHIQEDELPPDIEELKRAAQRFCGKPEPLPGAYSPRRKILLKSFGGMDARIVVAPKNRKDLILKVVLLAPGFTSDRHAVRGYVFDDRFAPERRNADAPAYYDYAEKHAFYVSENLLNKSEPSVNFITGKSFASADDAGKFYTALDLDNKIRALFNIYFFGK